MKKLDLRSIFRAMVLFSIAGGVFFLYYLNVRSQGAAFDRRNSRRLATFALQVRDSIQGYGEVISGLYQHPRNIPIDVEQFLWNQTDLETVSATHEKHEKGMRLTASDNWINFDYDPPGKIDSYKLQYPAPQAQAAEHPFNRQKPLSARAAIDHTLDYFVPHDSVAEPFDVIAVADEKGRVLYQSGNRDLRLGNITELFSGARPQSAAEKPKDKDKAVSAKETKAAVPPSNEMKSPAEATDYSTLVSASSMEEVEIVGARYKVYTQPLTIELPEGQPISWVALGFVRPDRFNAQSRSLPYPVLVLLLFLVAITGLSLPIVKLWSRRPFQRFGPRDVGMLAFSVFVIPGVLTIYATYLVQRTWLELDTSKSLERLAAQVSDNFQKESNMVLSRLAEFTKDLAQSAEQKKVTAASTNVLAKGSLLLRKGAGQPVPYNNFNVVYWTDEKGHQQVKWTSAGDVTPFLDLRDDESFRAFHDDRRATLEGIGTERAFALASERSPTTGENIAVFGTLVEPTIGKGDAELKAAFLVNRPDSLFDPVLPPGFEFCIIDASGLVMFHSNAHLNKSENLFEETDQSSALQSAVLGGSPRHLRASYKGRTRAFYVTQLKGVHMYPAPVLVVYKDAIYDETMTAEAATMASGLYAMYLIVLLIICGLAAWLVSKRGSSWLLASEKTLEKRWWTVGGSIALCGLSFVAIFTLSLSMLFYLPFVVSLIAVLLQMRLLLSEQGHEHLEGRTFGVRGLQICALAFGIFILNLSFVPALAFVRVAQVAETFLFLRYGQQKLAESIEQHYNDQHYKSVFSPADQQIWTQRFDVGDESLWIYPGAMFRSSVREIDTPAANAPQHYGLGVDFLLRRMNPYYNRISMEARSIGNSADGDWKWSGAGDFSETRNFKAVLYKNHFEGQNGKSLEVTSTAPDLLMRNGVTGAGVVAAAGLLILLICLLGIWRILKKLFPFVGGLAHSQRQPPPQKAETSMLLLVSPWETRRMPANGDFMLLDFDRLTNDPASAPVFESDSERRTIVLENVNLRFSDSTLSLMQYKALQWVIAESKQVVIVSDGDPAFLLNVESLDEASSTRWRRLLGRFRRLVVEPPPDLSDWQRFTASEESDSGGAKTDSIRHELRRECGLSPQLQRIGIELAGRSDRLKSIPQLVQEVEEAAEHYYQEIWAGCSPRERFVLFQIARRWSVLENQSAEVIQLVRKGLVCCESGLEIMNRSFESFVKKLEDPRASLVVNDKDTDGLFHAVLAAALVGLVAIVALALLFGQRDALQSLTAWVTGSLGLITAASRFLSTSSKPGEAKVTNA